MASTEKRNTRALLTGDGRKVPAMPAQGAPRIQAAAECDVLPELDRLIARVAARQCGLITRAQLQRLGLRNSAITERVASGKLHRMHRGVYLVGHAVPPSGAREMGAVLACGADSAISHRTAGELFEWLEPSNGPVHISLTSSRSRRERPGIRLHRPTTLTADDIGRHKNIAITSPIRTVLDIAATEPFAQVERATQQALITKRVTPTQLRERLRGQRGAKALQAILGVPRGRTESDTEDRIWALILKAGLPRPLRNAWLLGFKVDFHWPDARLVVEADSVAYHSLKASVEKDRRRDATLRAHGYDVLRFTWTQVAREPEVVIAGIAAALATRTAAPRR